MKISATLEHVRFSTIAAAGIARTCSSFLSEDGCAVESSFVNSVELAVGEACTNSVKHLDTARPHPAGVEITFQLVEDTLVIRVCDKNQPFAFDSQPEPDIHIMQESGYGIHIMKKSMDSVGYRREGGCNVITMKKRIPQGEEP